MAGLSLATLPGTPASSADEALSSGSVLSAGFRCVRSSHADGYTVSWAARTACCEVAVLGCVPLPRAGKFVPSFCKARISGLWNFSCWGLCFEVSLALEACS